LPAPFWLSTTPPDADTTNTAAAARHNTAAHRNLRDFMALKLLIIFRDCPRGMNGMTR
jgi:hypothetical protein